MECSFTERKKPGPKKQRTNEQDAQWEGMSGFIIAPPTQTETMV